MPKLDVYGVDHSPWVQAVLLGVHDKHVSHTLVTVPPFSVFCRSGIMMPAASFDGDPWQLESADILERLGYEPISPDDMRAIYGAWQGVLHRTDRSLRFLGGFSRLRDRQPSLPRRVLAHFRRSFTAFYFFLLIRLLVLSGRAPDPDDYADQFLHWQQKLEEKAGAYLGGAEPDMRDLLLFGVVQCHCSIPVPPVVVLRDDPRLGRLRSWIGSMQERFAGYPHLYSGAYFDPHSPPPIESTTLEQSAFWLGFVFMVASFPITLPLILFFAMRARRTPVTE